MEAVRQLKGRIYGVHLKDVAEQKEETESVAPGKGHLDVEGLFRELKNSGMPADAAISLEFESDPKNPIPPIRECLEVAARAARKASGA